MNDPIRVRVVDQERALLATALAKPEGAPLLEEVATEALVDDHVRVAWTAAQAAVRRGARPSVLLLAAAGLNEKELERLSALTHGAREADPGSVLSEYRRASATMKLAMAYAAAQGALAQPDSEPTLVALEVEGAVRACLNGLESVRTQSLVEAGEDFVASLRHETWSVPLPSSLDQRIGGLHERELLVVLGRSGHGKSCVAMTAAIDAALAGQRVLYVSREMPAPQLAGRMAAMILERTPNELRVGLRASEHEVSEFYGALRRVEQNFVIDDRCRDVREIEAEVRRAALAGEGYQLVVVDFIQQFDGPGEVKHEILENIAYRLKDMAMRERCAVIALAQVNRAGSREPDVPGMDAIRGSSGIENAADAILGISLGKRNSLSGEASIEAKVAKARNGIAGPLERGLVLRASLRVEEVPEMSLEVVPS
jgi:KaiC/GvpD/RAD55 family RecA-like ATPase